jgi:hypothetical protein
VTHTGITLSTSTGVPGQTVTVTGTNAVPSHAITFKINGATVTTTPAKVTASATGGFTAVFVVPGSAAIGSHIVTISDGSNTISVTFTRN